MEAEVVGVGGQLGPVWIIVRVDQGAAVLEVDG